MTTHVGPSTCFTEPWHTRCRLKTDGPPVAAVVLAPEWKGPPEDMELPGASEETPQPQPLQDTAALSPSALAGALSCPQFHPVIPSPPQIPPPPGGSLLLPLRNSAALSPSALLDTIIPPPLSPLPILRQHQIIPVGIFQV